MTTPATPNDSTMLDDDLRRRIDETNRRFVAAYNGGDLEALAEVYTRDARLLPPDAATVQGRSGILRFWTSARQTGLAAVQLSTVELQPLGDGAYEIGRATLTLESGATATAKYVVVWTQEDGRWCWHVDIWNAEPAGAEE